MLTSYGGLPTKLISNLLNALAKKMNYYTEDEMKEVVKKIFEFMRDVNCKGRRILEGFLDNIRKAYKTKSAPPPRKSKRKSKPQEDPFPAVYNEHLKALCNTILSQK